MSHHEVATLQYADACRQILDDAQCRLNDVVEKVQHMLDGSTLLMDSTLERMFQDLKASAKEATSSIDARRASIGNVAYSIEIQETKVFLSSVNFLYLQTDAIHSAVRTAYEQRMQSDTSHRRGLEEYLENVKDERLRTMMSLLARNKAHNSLSLDELRELAECRLDPSKKVRRSFLEDTVKDVRETMRDQKVSSENIEKVVSGTGDISPLEIMDSATVEIFDERLRRSAVQAITKSIAARGFIVKKENIRHIKETNTVKIVAKKSGGQTAEFTIDLDGKFMYRFDGYEGQACQKDIAPLERDLEDIYGIKLTDRKTIWDNPDKLTKKHHAEMKVRRN